MFLSKLIFTIKKPKVIIVAGNGKESAAEAIYNVLSQHFRVEKPGKIKPGSILKNEILIFSPAKKDLKDFIFLAENGSLPILVVTAVGEIPWDRDFFAGEMEGIKEIIDLAKILPGFGYLLLNFDDETVREIDDLTNCHCLNFGFQEGANFRASDIILNSINPVRCLLSNPVRNKFLTGSNGVKSPEISNGFSDAGTNFKINYRGNIVPFWLERLFGKEQIYSALSATAVGVVLGLNLVEISQAMRTYQGLPGKMKLVRGIKNSWILDGRFLNSVFSIIEALDILKKIDAPARKIAVLGDISAVGKYAIEAHEAIGEKADFLSAGLLFTVGPRAKFIAQSAQVKGLSKENIFQFNESKEAGRVLQEKMGEGDLVLIAGGTELKMEEIIAEIGLC